MSDLAPAGRDGEFSIVKNPRTIGDIGTLLACFSEPNIVELGIAYGGSTAFLALAGTPRRFLALDYRSEPVEILEDFLARHELTNEVRTAYGVDQSDVAQLRKLVADTFGSERLDLVVDDASHMYQPTVASFELLFPRLAPGGAFVIEDWAADMGIGRLIEQSLEDPESGTHDWAHQTMCGNALSGQKDQRPLATVAAERLGAPKWNADEQPHPLSRLVLQLVLAAAEHPDVIAAVEIDDEWATVWRGPADLGNDFSIDTIGIDRLTVLATE